MAVGRTWQDTNAFIRCSCRSLENRPEAPHSRLPWLRGRLSGSARRSLSYGSGSIRSHSAGVAG
eukprot:338671-Amphidinium_carterae.1